MNLFFSAQGIKAREILHANMEKIIEEKMERQQSDDEYHDAFDNMLSSAKEHGQELSIQELKVPRFTKPCVKKIERKVGAGRGSCKLWREQTSFWFHSESQKCFHLDSIFTTLIFDCAV